MDADAAAVLANTVKYLTAGIRLANSMERVGRENDTLDNRVAISTADGALIMLMELLEDGEVSMGESTEARHAASEYVDAMSNLADRSGYAHDKEYVVNYGDFERMLESAT